MVFFGTYNLFEILIIIFTCKKSGFNIIRYFSENIGINRAGPIPIGSGSGWHIRDMSGWKKSGSSRSGMKKIGSGRAARMPTPGLDSRFSQEFSKVWKRLVMNYNF